ncbi:hypothetical protein ACFQ0I_15965 [Mariniflexile aquimaris]|uniref:Haem-binding uptake Tiki superfamily ChaN domain-containing protein n=1 Tax=Mariniflexile aquimaris TaxID=881009 RepID=A0ABW3BY95_9FLAO
MRDLFKILTIIFITINFTSCNKDNKTDLKKYLENNWKSPEDYVIDKFKERDYIFVGEFHRIKQDVDFIKGIIPKLYENGVYNLAIEFGSYKHQHLLDSLLKLPKFDRKLAKEIYYKTDPSWNFKEYIDIYEEAWKVNSKLSNNDRKFRVINLSDGYIPCGESDEIWYDVDYDIFMADVIKKEIVDKEEKALIYLGLNHSVTKYDFPRYDYKKDSLKGYEKRTGNLIYDLVKDKSYTIALHCAWSSSKDYDKLVLPVHGKLDSVMDYFENKRIGFDLKNNLIGELKSKNSYYQFGQENFKLQDLCDGYIFLNKFIDSEQMTLEKDYYTADNIDEFKCYLKRLGKEDKFINLITVEKANNTDWDNIEKFKKILIE